jgi:hypothetical protein
MPTPERTRSICEALLQGIAELEGLDDSQELVSPNTRGLVEDYYEQFQQLAAAKGFIPRASTHSNEPTQDGNPDLNEEERELDHDQEEASVSSSPI